MSGLRRAGAFFSLFVLLAAWPQAALAQGSPPVGRYRDFGDALGFLNVLPPGSDGSLNGAEAIAAQAGTFPPHFIDQLEMYDGLVHASPGLTEDRIFEFFKDASFGVRENDVDRVYSPTAGVTVVRDASSGTPHIFGETRYATMFAQGYTAAEDRLFLMDALRHVGRARVSEFLGASPANQKMDREPTRTSWPTSTASTSTSLKRSPMRASFPPSTRRSSSCRCPGSPKTRWRSRRSSAGSSARAAAAS
jgi:hypothetical protein